MQKNFNWKIGSNKRMKLDFIAEFESQIISALSSLLNKYMNRKSGSSNYVFHHLSSGDIVIKYNISSGKHILRIFTPSGPISPLQIFTF
jgi:hypothetical protein